MYHDRDGFTDRLRAVPLDLGRRLLAAGVVVPGEVRRALFSSVSTDKPLARALADCSTAARTLFAQPIEEGAHPTVRTVIPDPELSAALPQGLMARLLAVPVRRDTRTGTVDIAVVDPIDAHVLAELLFHVRGKVRLLAAPLAEIERALLLVGSNKRVILSTTSDYEAAPKSMVSPKSIAPPRSMTPPIDVPPPSRAIVEPISQPLDEAVPLVRRARPSLTMPRVRPASDPPEAIPLSRTRVSMAPPPMSAPPPSTSLVSIAPTTTPIERKADSERREEPRDERRDEQAVQMVVDFRAASRAEKDESDAAPRRRKLEPRRPPFPSLTKVLETIDVAKNRAALIEAILRGLLTTSVAAALFAPRKGKFVGVGAIGDVEPDRIRVAAIPPTGAVADAIAKNERLGTIDPGEDHDLYAALGLERFASVHVLIHPSFVADKAAMLLVAFGMGDVIESTRRARVLSTAAASAMERMLSQKSRV